MKKFFTLALLAVGMTVMAQNVTPLSIQIPELKLDSLRSLYISEPAMYRASLEVLAGQFAEVDKQLKNARTELKAELDHSKVMASLLKETGSTASSLAKLYTKEAGEIKDMQKTIEKQQKSLKKQSALNQKSRESFSNLLDAEQKQLNKALKEIAERQHDINNLQSQLSSMQTTLQGFDAEIVQKNADLTALENLYKERLAILKAEQKTAKSF